MSLTQLKGKNDNYPSFSGKAAPCRHLAEFVLLVAKRHKFGTPSRPPFEFRGRLAGQEDVYLDNLVSMCEGMSEFHAACKAEPFVEDACRSAMRKCLQSLETVHKLWRQDLTAAEAAKQPFHLRPKSHEMQHLVEEKLPLWGSPSNCWCYRDEDFIGAVKHIASKSLHPATIEQRVMEKLLILSALGFQA
jgi:hypothetical protein